MGLSKKLLQRRWTHSHEEDSDTTAVYRPADFAFPPARGRRSFDLGPGGRYTESAPGPSDKPRAGGGKWDIDGDRIVIRDSDTRAMKSLVVESVSKERLVLKKPK
jgi:hypothetical protein